MEIQHSSHKHNLYLAETRVNEELKRLRCKLCGKELRGLFYTCRVCYRLDIDYDIHFLCAMPFLQEIDHPSHSNHPLILQPCVTDKLFTCCICHKNFVSYVGLAAYTCVKCNLHMHASCVLRIPTVPCESKDHNQRLCHKRPMRLVDIKDREDDRKELVECYMCELPISRQAYTCKICKNFFHINSCTELSAKMRHPLHPRHRLILKTRPGKDAACHHCHKTYSNFIYHCPHAVCNFYVCIGCTLPVPTVRPSIKYQGHNHLLCLAKKVHRDDDFECCASYTYCKQLGVSSNELTHTQDYIFCCENCDHFGVHLLCGPLPCTIKHKDHLHPLTLYDSMVEDDSGEYYCDDCETERDPRICVYYCADCKYIAHVHCVISEVVRVLQGDCREVELRVVGQTSSHLVLKMKEEEEVTQMTLLDMFTSVGTSMNIDYGKHQQNQEEEEEAKEEEAILKAEENRKVSYIMNSFLKSRKNYVSDQGTKLNISEELVISQKQVGKNKGQEYFSSSFTDENLEELIHSFDYRPIRWSEVTSHELKLKIVNVGGYMITWNLAHVMKDLLAKHGDLSGGDQNKSSSPEFYEIMSLLYFFLCRMLYNMSRIMVVDLTEDLIGDWYSCLKFLKSNGFEVDFIISHLHQIVRAYVGLQVNRAEIATRARLDDKILNLREEIVNLEDKLKRCKEDLVICEERKRSERARRGSSETSTDLVKECLNMSSQFKWKNVAYGLL